MVSERDNTEQDGQRTRSNSGRSQGSHGSRIPRPVHGPSQRPPMPQQQPIPRPNYGRPQYGTGTRTPPSGWIPRPPQSGYATPRSQMPQSSRSTPRKSRSRTDMSDSSPAQRPPVTHRPLPPPVPAYQASTIIRSHPSTLSRRTTGSHYVSEIDPEDVPAQGQDIDDKVSEISSEDEELQRGKRTSHIVSQASLGKKVRPVITTMGSWGSGPRSPMSNSTSPRDSPASEHPSMEMLSAAIRQGLSPSPTLGNNRPRFSRNNTDPLHVRMPFAAHSPPLASPTSIYTDCTVPHKGHESVPMSAYNQGLRGRSSLPLTILENDLSDREGSRPGTRLKNSSIDSPAKSEKSTAQLLGLGIEQRGMSDKIPPGKRPPRLDIGAVRNMEARGSTTSLTDLIRRATKLASNLDRGKTASKFGHLDMFGPPGKLGGSKLARDSTYSDMLAAFPNPAPGTPDTMDRNRQTMWPSNEKGHSRVKSTATQKTGDHRPRRKCLGLSPAMFILVILIIVALIAAAVLVPVFLVVIPNQKAADAAKCSAKPCHNGGVITNVNNVCACICAGGFTGDDCSTASDPDCVSATISDGFNSYKNATMGSSIMPLLSNAQSNTNVPLNATVLLGTFSSNNLSCASENSLVTFNSFTNSQRKRLVIFDDVHPDFQPLHLPGRTTLSPVPTQRAEMPRKRQNTEQGAHTENGIVFASSTEAGGGNSPATTSAASGSASTANASPSSTGSGAAPTASGSNVNPPSDGQTAFGGAVVLYVLEQTKQITNAVEANQAIASYFRSGGIQSGKTTVQVAAKVIADFSNLSIQTK